jgi:hypothetical protein
MLPLEALALEPRICRRDSLLPTLLANSDACFNTVCPANVAEEAHAVAAAMASETIHQGASWPADLEEREITKTKLELGTVDGNEVRRNAEEEASFIAATLSSKTETEELSCRTSDDHMRRLANDTIRKGCANSFNQ